MNMKAYYKITDEIEELANLTQRNLSIEPELYTKYDVKRGLRDLSGRGVLAGLTKIAEVKSYTIDDAEMIPCEGKLFYHGINIQQIVDGFVSEKRFGFEETAYLLIFGELPTEEKLNRFSDLLANYSELPPSFTRDVILKSPSRDVMNAMARSVLTMYSYDLQADDLSISNLMRQSLQLISLFPRLAVYGYHAAQHFHEDQSLYIHSPKRGYSTAQNILHMLRSDNSFTDLEAEVLDVALVVHADHGGGNNSTFATRVVSSSGTDTYSAIAAALGSLKGPRHGGANIKVARMFDDIKDKVKHWDNDGEIRDYLANILDKKAFDQSGLIYGMGHAVYSLSDPRAEIFKGYVKMLSKEKQREEEFALYSRVAELAPELIGEKRKIYKGVSANVDFYSGFVYKLLGLPEEIYTPLFATARVAGWCAHRMEEIISGSKIIRPAYKNIGGHKPYIPMSERT
ncbi:MAG: citrate/2-methylcitrate synthase [Oscillospiraceae bacterium]|jgi:citrate synthase|nr:citrate/2-methylcitrate synthase [Oscillospiraceae bacterium]